MKTEQSMLVTQDTILDELVTSCNEIHSIVYQSSSQPVSRDQNGPLRWRESCDKMIAVARDVLQYRIILETTAQAKQADVFRVGVTRRLPANLMFDRIDSIFVDGEVARPTNHSLHRTLDLDFHQIKAGSVAVITYSARVNFNAETTRVAVGDTDVRWSWVSCGKRLHAEAAHPLQRRGIATPRNAKQLAKVNSELVGS